MYPLDINFLKDRGLDTQTETVQAPKKAAPIAEKIPILVGGIVAVLALFSSWNYANSFESKQAEAETRIQEIDAEIARRQGESKSLEEMQVQVTQARAETQALVGVFDKIRPWSAILQEVSDRTPPGVQVSSLSQSGSGNSVKLQISGTARSFADVNDFVLFLQRSPFFNDKGIILGNVNQGNLQIEIANKDDIPDNVDYFIPQGVNYNITAQLSNTPPSSLIKELEQKGAIGIVTRLKTLERKGAIAK